MTTRGSFTFTRTHADGTEETRELPPWLGIPATLLIVAATVGVWLVGAFTLVWLVVR